MATRKHTQGDGFWARLFRRLRGSPSGDKPASPVKAPKLELMNEDFVPTEEFGSSSGAITVGIDFGTSYTSVARLTNAGVVLADLGEGRASMPSVVSFPAPGEMLVGWPARQRLAGSAQWTIASPKRLLGRLYKDPAAQSLFSGLAFRSFAGSDRFVRFEAHGKILSAHDICATILASVKQQAEASFGSPIDACVLAAPVGFGSLQRSALQQAAQRAGLEVRAVISEPTAALLAQGFPKGWHGKAAVYDFGGGTFDFAVLEVSDAHYRMLCSGGDPWLGGDDMDASLAGLLADAFSAETGVDLRQRAVEWQSLLFAAEQAKRELGERKSTEIRVDSLLTSHGGSRGLECTVTRKQFNHLIEPLIERSITVANNVLRQAGLEAPDIDAVIMTGGTSLVPAVQHAVHSAFHKAPHLKEPHLAVAQGTAIHAAALGGSAVAHAVLRARNLQEVVGRTIGACADGGPLITVFERDTGLPARRQERFTTPSDGLRQLVIRLFENPTSRVDEARPLGRLVLKGLHGLPAGQEGIEVVFSMDSNGMLAVSANIDGKTFGEKINTRGT